MKEISPRVSVIREGVTQPMFQWGMSLFENDEVQTGKNGRAEIQFSSNGTGNEIILGANTRIRISRTISRYDYSIYRVTVLEGKIWAKDLPSQNRKVQLKAGKSNIIPFGGQYVVEQDEQQTLAAASSGNIRLLDKSTDKYTPLPPGEIASVSSKTGALTLMVIPKQLMADFQSKDTPADGESSRRIKALVADRNERIDEILAQEAREAAEKKAREEALKKKQKEAELRAIALAMERKEAEKARAQRELAEKRAGEVEQQRNGQKTDATAKTAVVAGLAAKKTKEAATAEQPVQPRSTGTAQPQQTKSQGRSIAEQQPAPVEESPKRTEQKPPVNNRNISQKTQQPPPTETSRETKVIKPKPEENSPERRVKYKAPKGRRSSMAKKRETVGAPKEESLLQTFKWDIVTISTAVVFSWLASQEALGYDDLESKNNSLESLIDSATTTSQRSALETQYEVNKSKMSTYKSNVSLYNNIMILAVLFEGYLIYDHLFGEDPNGNAALYTPGYKNIINPDTVVIGVNNPSKPAGINLTLGWKW